MADPLSLLRQYNVNKKEITTVNNYVCFGEYCWPKTVKTNFLVYGSTRDGPNKEYYTLECLLYLLNNVNIPHPNYVKKAAAEQVPVVRRPDRKDLLAYLVGDTVTSNSIDRSAPLELPISYAEVLRQRGDVQQQTANQNLVVGQVQAPDDDSNIPNKMAKLDVMKKAKEQFSARLDAPKIKKPTSAISTDEAGNELPSATSLSEAMSIEKINALKAKRLAKKRSTIIDAENEFDKDAGQSASAVAGSNILLKFDKTFTKEIQSKERVWRNRSTILQSTGKNFAKSIFPILQSIKNREEGAKKPGQPISGYNLNTPMQRNPLSANTPTVQPLTQQQQYNRYDQERFNRSDPAIGFKIDTTGTYHGLELKNVTEGTATPKQLPASGQPFNDNQLRNTLPKQPQKRVSRTPIIIVPATPTSLITMNNCKCILQELKFVDNKSSGDRKELDVLIQRKKPDNSITMYRVIDNPLKLQPQDWSRVVAVFVQGPAWQFKGWPWQGNPVEIFSVIKAFHLKFDEMKLDANVAKWNVEVIELSRNKRHLDRANLLKFWSTLEQHMVKHKHNLKF